MEFVGELGIDSLRRGRVSRPFAQQPIYRFAQPFWEIFPLAAGGETPPLRPYKLEFDGLSNSRSLRASDHTGVAIPRIDVPLLVDKFQKTSQKNGLYDDRLPGIRWRFPHQRARWFGMTCSDGAPIAMSGISMPRRKFVLPPAPVCALVPPPSQVRGARRLSTRAP